jgi:hypothetical protein
MLRRTTTLLMLVLLSGVGCASFTGSAQAAGCDRYASPSGSDNASGTSSSPYRTVARLDNSLSPGQTGCLLAGTYGNLTSSTANYLDHSGSPTGQITITSYPGATVTIVGLIDLAGSYTTLNGVNIDGSNTTYATQRADTTCAYPVSNGLEIDGQGDILQYNNYYQSVASLRGNGFGIGWSGQADNTIIRYNRIHDVGGCDFYDHLIYLAKGNNVQIYDNWLWNDPHGWGIKLDPGPTNARIWGNVIDGAGSGFNFGNSSGDEPTAGNQVFHNVVMNSVGVSNPDIGWSNPGVLVTSPGLLPSSTGNQVDSNDSVNNSGGLTDVMGVSPSQLSVTNSVSVDPGFVDPAAHDYAVVAGSPLAGWGLWNGGLPAITTPIASATPVAPPTVQAKPKPAERAVVKKARSKSHPAKKRKPKRKAKRKQHKKPLKKQHKKPLKKPVKKPLKKPHKKQHPRQKAHKVAAPQRKAQTVHPR